MPDDKVSDPAPDGVLYSFRRCPYAMRARMALAASGLDPEIREVALKAKPAEMLALGSTTVPVMRLADGTVLRESRDIMGWAQSRTPQAMPYRDDGALTALVDAVDGPFKAALDRYKYPDRFADEDTSDARARAVAVLRSIDGLITDAGFLDGEEPGFHDAAVFPFVRQFAGVDAQWFQSLAVDPSGPMPKLVAWWSQMREHPWFGSIMKKLKPWAPQDPPIRFRSTLVS